jgi:hypothetical protein
LLLEHRREDSDLLAIAVPSAVRVAGGITRLLNSSLALKDIKRIDAARGRLGAQGLDGGF